MRVVNAPEHLATSRGNHDEARARLQSGNVGEARPTGRLDGKTSVHLRQIRLRRPEHGFFTQRRVFRSLRRLFLLVHAHRARR